jgi:hypothetical protein
MTATLPEISTPPAEGSNAVIKKSLVTQWIVKEMTMRTHLTLWHSSAQNRFILAHRSPGPGFENILRLWPGCGLAYGAQIIALAVSEFGSSTRPEG